MPSLVSSSRLSSKPVVEFSMATYLLEMEKRLQSAQADLKDDLKAAQADLRNSLQSSQTDLKDDLKAAQTDLRNSLQSSHTDLKNSLQSAQKDSEQRMLNSQKEQIFKIVFLGASVGFTAFTILEIGMRIFGYGITKLG